MENPILHCYKFRCEIVGTKFLSFVTFFPPPSPLLLTLVCLYSYSDLDCSRPLATRIICNSVLFAIRNYPLLFGFSRHPHASVCLILSRIFRIAFVVRCCRPCYLQYIFTFKRSIKVQFDVVQFNIFRDKLAENFAFVLGNAIIFRVYSTGFLSPFSIAGFSRGYYANPFKVCY